MTTKYMSRASWTTTSAGGSSFSNPRGFACHWPGAQRTYGVLTVAQETLILRGFWRFHVVTRRWKDVAYQACVTQAGRVYDLRGVRRKSAANGSSTANDAYGALLLLIGPGEEPTQAMHDAIRDWRATRWLTAHPDATVVTSHSAVRGGTTTCPGPAAMAHIAKGTWRQAPRPTPAPAPAPDQEDDVMAMTPEQRKEFAAQIAKATVDEWHSRRPISTGPTYGQMLVYGYRAVMGLVAAFRAWAPSLPQETATAVVEAIDKERAGEDVAPAGEAPTT